MASHPVELGRLHRGIFAVTRITTPLDSAIDDDGFTIVDNVGSAAQVAALLAELTDVGQRGGIQRRGGVLAIRNLLELVPSVARLARSTSLRGIAESVLGPDCFAVRGILFDKTPATNWKVAWHQDLTIAVKERLDVPGFGPWSEKAGVVSVQPPVSVLKNMITIRVHLDDCGPDNGPVRVLPGSHQSGRLDVSEIEEWRKVTAPVETIARRGAALVMRPLLLHASSPATQPGHRRVVHLDYAFDTLPGGLEWHMRI
jgi:phytanoyl-CoA dioxygenase PhyH